MILILILVWIVKFSYCCSFYPKFFSVIIMVIISEAFRFRWSFWYCLQFKAGVLGSLRLTQLIVVQVWIRHTTAIWQCLIQPNYHWYTTVHRLLVIAQIYPSTGLLPVTNSLGNHHGYGCNSDISVTTSDFRQHHYCCVNVVL